MYSNSCGNVVLPQKKAVIRRTYRLQKGIANMKVIEITSTKEPKTFFKLAAYCRVSSDSADQLHSFATQIRYYTDYAKKHNEYELIDIYADEGLTGTCMNKRDEFNRMIRDCQKGRIDRIIVKSVSRFARNTKELLMVIRMLKGIGISIYFEEQGIDTDKMNTEMILTFPGMVAQQESETISGNMRWSYKKRMESGEFNSCNAAYGYKLVDGQLVINEPEAEVVRKIFDLYLQGIGKQAIANFLNDNNVPRRYSQTKWYIFTVDYILNNERYMGDALLQKSYTTGTLPYKKKRNKGELPQYYVENSNPPIVCREVFQAAKELQQSRAINKSSKEAYPLSGVLRCPDCGHTFRRQIVNGETYWICSYKSSGRTQCSNNRVREDAIYNTFNIMMRKLSANRQHLIGTLIHQLEESQLRSSDTKDKIYQIDKDIADLSAKNHVIARLHTKGILNDTEHSAQSSNITHKLNSLRIERRKKLSEDENDMLIDTLKELDNILSEYLPSIDFNEDLFQQVVTSITVISCAELRFTIMGDINFREKI